MTNITTTLHRAMSHRLHLDRLLTANALHAPLPAAVAPGTRSAASGRAGRFLLVQSRAEKPSREVRDASRPLSGGDGSRGWATPPVEWPSVTDRVAMVLCALGFGAVWIAAGRFIDALASAWFPGAVESVDGLATLFLLVAIVAAVFFVKLGGC